MILEIGNLSKTLGLGNLLLQLTALKFFGSNPIAVENLLMPVGDSVDRNWYQTRISLMKSKMLKRCYHLECIKQFLLNNCSLEESYNLTHRNWLPSSSRLELTSQRNGSDTVSV
jgi:hypothetical protein